MTLPDPYLRNWLLDTGSLTERLQSHCHVFDLHLLGQRQMQPELEEISQISSVSDPDTGDLWQIREVILKGNEQPWVFARSIICEQLCQVDFAGLGGKPLGQIIFNDNRFTRHPFQLVRIPKEAELICRLNLSSEFDLWGRRSVFTYKTFSLMVAEVFLPESPAYQYVSGK